MQLQGINSPLRLFYFIPIKNNYMALFMGKIYASKNKIQLPSDFLLIDATSASEAWNKINKHAIAKTGEYKNHENKAVRGILFEGIVQHTLR